MVSVLKKSILLIFAFNILSIYLYFLPRCPLPAPEDPDDDRNELSSLKPWPSLPSYLPWPSNPSRDPESCESFFGNGFTRRVDFLRRGRDRGWFRCHHNAVLGSSVCEGGRVRMASGRIRMARGGERLEEVLGRKEEEELPVFEEGAFEVEGDGGVWFAGRKWGNGWKRWRVVGDEDLERFLPGNGVERHTMRELIGNLTVIAKGELQCDQVSGLVFSR
ncbi:hypothetical protein MLD38_024905 [Melastoma candidum]|uniref:Uncharacterized protein n=1 Tax=Melastoma candidum TaxID=119954 RepID=A0ACB9NX74_9MYRT|nr:hypothetical protein MLD38_024905 [Melastoma candidum]